MGGKKSFLIGVDGKDMRKVVSEFVEFLSDLFEHIKACHLNVCRMVYTLFYILCVKSFSGMLCKIIVLH